MSEPLTQASVPPYTVYATDGIQTTFAYPWYLQSSAELKAYSNGTLTTNYTVTNVGVVGGGNVVFFAAPATGVLVLYRDTPQVQDTELTGSTLQPATLAAMFNKLCRQIQDYQERFSRIPQLPVWIASLYRNMVLPAPVPGQLLGYDSTGVFTTYDAAIRQVTVDPANGMTFGKTTQTLTAASFVGLDTLTATALFPANSIGLGVSMRTTVPFNVTNSLTTASLGDSDTIDAWGAGIAVTATTPQVDSLGRTYYARNTAGQWVKYGFRNGAARTVYLRADGGRFATLGTVILTAHWQTFLSD